MTGRRRARDPVLGAALLVLSLASVARAGPAGWVEDFALGRLDPARWERTFDGDGREWSAEVVPGEARAPLRLRLRADTRGTRDDTVKWLGVRTVRPIPLREGTRIVVRLDWGEQANGSYLTAGIVLSPHATGGNPRATPDWLEVAYAGVPPGRNARMVVGLARNGRERTVTTEGWPDRNRQGRRIGVQELSLRVRNGSLEVREGSRQVWTSEPDELALGEAYLYLQMSSHSNYPARSIYFERVEVR
jgi:hypothetical protein